MSNLIKRTFLVSMVVMTALWGVMGVINVASANVAVAGDLIKSSSSPAVYYLDSSNVKHPFHHEREYYTWYQDFSLVKTVPTDEMVGYTLGSTVVVRPGSRLAQYVEVLGDGTWNVSNSPEVYAVGASGNLHHLSTAADAVALYGSNWETMIVPLPNYLNSNYALSTALTSSSTYPSGTLVKTADATQIYYVDGTTKRPVTDAGFTANRFDLDYVLTVSSLTAYTDGTSITAVESGIADPIAGVAAPVAGTGVTVALAADNPGTQVVPLSATNVPMMKFNLTASSDGAVTVTALTFTRMGVGATADFSYLYLYDGATRLTNGKTLNSTTHKVQFTNLSLQVAAGTTKTYTLMADVASTTSGNVNYFQLASGDITTTATINGTFPINSNAASWGSSTAGTVTVSKNGTLANPVVGQQNADLAMFKLTAGSGEDIVIQRVSLYYSGSVSSSYITNLKLYQSTTLLASTSALTSNNLAVFDLSASPYTITKNNEKIFKVTGNVGGQAQNSQYTKFYLENTVDLYALGQTFGYGAGVDIDNSDGYDGNDTTCTSQTTCADSTYLVVQGGQITVAFNGPSASTVDDGQTGVAFMNFSVTGGVNAEIRQIRVELHNDDGSGSDLDNGDSTCGNNYIYNIKVIDLDNGESTSAVNCSSYTDIGTNAGVRYLYNDYFTVNAGQTRNFAIKADLHSTLASSSGNDYYVVLGDSTAGAEYTLSTSAGVKNTENNQWITDIVPTSKTQGNDMTIASASLGASLASNIAAQTYVQGTNNATVLDIAFKAGQGSDVTMTSLALTGYIASTSPTGAGSVQSGTSCTTGAGTTYCIDMGADSFAYVNNMVNTLKIYDITADPNMTTNLNSTVEDMGSSDGVATFSNMSWTIPAGTTHILRVAGNINSTAYSNTLAANKYVKLNIAAATDVGVVDENGASITLTDDDGTTYAIADINGAATTMGSSYYIDIAQSGTLNVTAESNPPIANVVAGSSAVPMLNLKFQAINEAFNVNKVRIYQDMGGSNRDVDSITISYTNAAGATVDSTITPVASTTQSTIGVSDFNITSNPLYVAAGQSKIVNVKFNLRAINATSGAYTGDALRAKFKYDGNFEAKGAGSSSTNLTDTSNNADVTGNIMVVHGGLMTVTADTPVQSLSGGPNDLYRWKVTTTEGGSDIAVKKLSFKLSVTDSVTNSATLYLQNFQVLEGNSYDGVSILTQGDNGTDHYQVYNGWGVTTTIQTGDSTSGGKLSAATAILYHNNGSLNVAPASASTTHDIIVVFNDDRLVTPSQAKYYILRATAGNVDTGASSNDSASMYMYDGDTATASNRYISASCMATGTAGIAAKYCLGRVSSGARADDSATWLMWSDNSGTNGNLTHTDTAVDATSSTDWFNGYYIKTLSTQKTLN